MSITVLNSNRSEFDFSKLTITTDYNIVLHCVYDPYAHFEEEFAFLHDPSYDSNTVILLWHPVEQGFFHPVWMEKLDAIVEKAPYRLIYLTGCSHKPNVKKIFPHKFTLQFLPIFDVRAVEIWDVNMVRGSQPITLDKPNKFMFINAKDISHRRYMLGQLIRHDLVKDGVVSYRCHEGFADLSLDFDVPRGFSVEQLEHIHETYDLCLPHLPMKIDDSNVSGGLPRSLFLDSYLGIIGETHYINPPYGFNTSFVSEKTFNAIANNQMFIIVGQAKSLELLKSLGYKTFSSVIDESYDDMLFNGERLTAVTNEVIRFVSRPIEEIRRDYEKVAEIIQHNRDLLFKQNLQDRFQNFINTL